MRTFAGCVAIVTMLSLGCQTPMATSIAKKLTTKQDFVSKEVILVCRSQVLQLENGTRSPGIVAQAFLIEEDTSAPIVAPEGTTFKFQAWDQLGQENASAETWQFESESLLKHHVDHALGPCYVYWLPCELSQSPQRSLELTCQVDMSGQSLSALPVKVVVPGY